MPSNSLNRLIEELKENNELLIIDAPVNCQLEVTEIIDRLSKSDKYNKAVLFTNNGTDFPLLINAFGSDIRMAKALRVQKLDKLETKVSDILKSLIGKHESLIDKIGLLPKIAQAAKWLPKKTFHRGKCQEDIFDMIDILRLPILKCWPYDGGRFITLPCVHTISPDNGTANVGMYRMQVFDGSTLGVHWHKHKTGARHYEEYKVKGKKMPISVTLGGDPIYTFVATAPLPDGFDEYLLAGFLRNKSVKLVKCLTNDIWVPEDVDFVIEGFIDTSEDLILEGPFGDHTGFYSLPDLYPIMHVTAITHRKEAVYPSTIVGIPPMEDAFIAKATEFIFKPLIKFSIVPEMVDIHMPIWGVAHNLVLVSIKKHYYGQAFKVAQALWGAGQMMFNKTLCIFDHTVDLQNYAQVVEIIRNNLRSYSQILFSRGPIDILDHATDLAGFGGKVCIDLTSIEHSYNSEVGEASFIFKYIDDNSPVTFQQFDDNIGSNDSFVLIVLESALESLSIELRLWYILNNIDPQRDIQVNSTNSNIRMIIDGRKKQHGRLWPNVITMSQSVINKVDHRWYELTGLPFIASPSLTVNALVKSEGAVAD